MKLLEIYRCLCDATRLRILHLLAQGPLCVCHFQTLLGAPQVAISKHLAYLRARGLVIAQRHEQWMIYRLPEQRPHELHLQLQCLQDCVQEVRQYREDASRLVKVRSGFGSDTPTCVREPSERLFGTVGANVAALDRGARVFRVHDVAANRQALDVAWAIIQHDRVDAQQ